MKKLIALAFCFALAVSILTGCRSTEDKKTTDTTTTPSTVTTAPTTHSTAPTTEATQPTGDNGTETIPDSGSMPNNGGNNDTGSGNGTNGGTGSTNGGNSGSGSANGGTGMEGSMNNGTAQSRAHYPSIVGGSR